MAAKRTEYLAICRHDSNYFEGDLEEIRREMEVDDCDIDDYVFYVKSKPVEVVLEKKLTLVLSEA